MNQNINILRKKKKTYLVFRISMFQILAWNCVEICTCSEDSVILVLMLPLHAKRWHSRWSRDSFMAARCASRYGTQKYAFFSI